MRTLRLQDGVGESHSKGGIWLAGTSHYLHWPEEGAEEAICCFGIFFFFVLNGRWACLRGTCLWSVLWSVLVVFRALSSTVL